MGLTAGLYVGVSTRRGCPLRLTGLALTVDQRLRLLG